MKLWNMKQKDNERMEEYYKRVLHLASQLRIKATNIYLIIMF
jgi:hypothetical protein